MKKKIFILLIFLVCCIASAYSDELPLGHRWIYKNGGMTLNGKKFYYIADSYREQHNWFYLIDGAQIDCWLYDTYTYHDGDGTFLLEKAFPAFIEINNATIDWSKSVMIDTIDAPPQQIKELMKEMNCDIFAFVSYGNWFNVINYDKVKNKYWSYVYKFYCN